MITSGPGLSRTRVTRYISRLYFRCAEAKKISLTPDHIYFCGRLLNVISQVIKPIFISMYDIYTT